MMRRRSLLGVLLGLLVTVGAGAQTVAVDEPGVCFDCHSNIAAETKAGHVHRAFSAGKCSRCHNPHASKHAALLSTDQGTLCLSCHENVRVEIDQESAHLPAANKECVGCHHPHASEHAGQLRQELTELCGDCHAQSHEWTKRPVVHSPVDDGECLTCHAPHGSTNEGLLKGSVASVCFGCHERDSRFTKAHQGRRLGNVDCTACHDPHAASRSGLLRANQHAPFAGGDCGTCHPASGDDEFATKSDVKALCLECHRTIGQFEGMAHHHNLDDDRSCVNCHNPHASDGNALLMAEPEVLCVRCHFDEPGRREKAFYSTHDGMRCTECHVPHGADNAKYLRRLDVELCARCHEAAHRTSHPVGPEVIDARTGEPVTCLSCHQLHGAAFEKYLPLSPEMDLCIQCHKR